MTVEEIARRMAETLPSAKLIALLREPLARAQSQHRMNVKRGRESRDLPTALAAGWNPAELERARSRPTEINSYLVQGEYGRVLGIYLRHVPRDRLLVLRSSDLAGRTVETLRSVTDFLGVEPHPGEGLDSRHHVGGDRRRIDRAAAEELTGYLDREVWPHTAGGGRAKRAFRYWFEQWNTIVQPAPPLDLPARLEAELKAHFAADAGAPATLGVKVPWLADGAG